MHTIFKLIKVAALVIIGSRVNNNRNTCALTFIYKEKLRDISKRI